jgi:hypothetical protein
MGPTPLSLDKATPSRAVSLMDSRVTVVMASQQILQGMARAAMDLLMDRLRTVSSSYWAILPLSALFECFLNVEMLKHPYFLLHLLIKDSVVNLFKQKCLLVCNCSFSCSLLFIFLFMLDFFL